MYESLIEIAKRYLFVKEAGVNGGRWINLFNSTAGCAPGSPYCASFINHCLTENFERHGFKSSLNFSPHVMTLYRQNTPAYAPVPRPGLLMSWNHVGTAMGHVGLIVEVTASGVVCCEANTSPGLEVEREGEGIYLKTRRLEQVGKMKPNAFYLDPYWSLKK